MTAWKINPQWQYEPDAADGSTRVDLEHRYFERHGASWDAMPTAVDDSVMGWGGLLEIYSQAVTRS